MVNFSDKTDRELLELLSSSPHRHKAFRALYDRYSARVYTYCLKMTGNKDDAGDIYQDVFTKFFTKACDRGIEYNNVGGYLFTMARNATYNFLNSQKKFVPVENIINTLSYEMGNESELQQIIDIAVSLLAPKYREIYILKEQLGYNYAEISEMTELTYNGVKSRYRRAMQDIIQHVKPYIDEY